MLMNTITQTPVGADLSCTSPIYRPWCRFSCPRHRVNVHTQSHSVMLSAAKGLARQVTRCFAEFTLSATNGLSMTGSLPAAFIGCHPERSEGSRHHRPSSCSLPFFTQVSPVGIHCLDQGNLLCAQPSLNMLLPRDSSVHIRRFFKVD